MQQVAAGDGRAVRHNFRTSMLSAITEARANKKRSLFAALVARPELLFAIVDKVSAGTWNLIVPDYGTVSSPTGSRPSQGYGLGAISEKWVGDLRKQANFIFGSLADRMSQPQSPPLEYYSNGPILTSINEGHLWVLLLAGSMDAQLGTQLTFGATGTTTKPGATSAVAHANRLANEVAGRDSTGMWLLAWWRFSSVKGASDAIVNKQLDWGGYRDILNGYKGQAQ